MLIGGPTYALVRDAVDAELDAADRGEGKVASRSLPTGVRSLTGDAAFARRTDAPLVGRERERKLLEDAWDRACSENTCVQFTILGSAGVGSRGSSPSS